MLRVHFVGNARSKRDGWKLRCAGQRHLDDAWRMCFQKRQFMPGKRTHGAKLSRDNSGHAADRRSLAATGLPFPADSARKIKAIYGIGKVAHEVSAAQFTVSKDFKTQFLLSGKDR